MVNKKYLGQLQRKIVQYFNIPELRTVCLNLNIDYDALAGNSLPEKVQDLLGTASRHNRLLELVEQCKIERVHVNWSFNAKIFIFFENQILEEKELATFLANQLIQDENEIFIDNSTNANISSLSEIEHQLLKSDFLIVLLSGTSADSESLQYLLQHANSQKKTYNTPEILPIRLAYHDILPYTIAQYLTPTCYFLWESNHDNFSLLEEIRTAINGHIPNRTPILRNDVHELIASEDGRIVGDAQVKYPPLPEFDPRILDNLTAPGGTMRLRDQFYVERDADSALIRQIGRPGTVTTIRASRQTGKSSLLVRGLKNGKSVDTKIVNLDLQQFDKILLNQKDQLMRSLAEHIVYRLRLDANEVERAWQNKQRSPQDKLTFLMEEYILPEVDAPIILAIDEADRMLETGYASDFFALIRSWFNYGAYNDLWENLSIIMVISTEPYLLIKDATQSPFNVGLEILLSDFNPNQIETLNRKHGSPIQEKQFNQFVTLLNGHPFLTRMALYQLTVEKMSWAEFMEFAPSVAGPFGQHLRRQLWLINNEDDLQRTLKQIISKNRCDDEMARFRLRQAGLIREEEDSILFRCDLYRQFFSNSL